MNCFMREKSFVQGGVQAFPSNLTMIGFLDIQTSIVTQPDRCLVCQTQNQGKFIRYKVFFFYLPTTDNQ